MPWLVLSMGLLSSGCLVPQDDYILPGTPFFQNHPPYFVNVDPTQSATDTNNGGTTCQLSFSVTVADPDIDDRVRVNFYVDWELIPGGGSKGPAREFGTTNTGQAVRPETITFTTDPANTTNELHTPGTHTVEAVVFDGILSPERIPENREAPFPDAGIVPSYAIISRWAVITSEGQCPP